MDSRLNNLYVCKEWLTSLDLLKKHVLSQDFVGRCSVCGVLNIQVTTIKLGRYSGDLCCGCVNREQEFVNELLSLDDSLKDKYIYKRGSYEFDDEQQQLTIKKPITNKQVVKPSKKRAILEENGQGNLFDFY